MPAVSFRVQKKELMHIIDKEVGKAALGFQTEITKAWPVDTGYSRNAWQAPKRVDVAEWQVINDVIYASVLWKGEHIIGDKLYGSPSLPNGGYPILNKTSQKLVKRLKAI